MQNSENTIYFNFSYFALKLLGKGLYSNAWTAIAELVANGFDARATNVKIYINAINKKHSVIEIFDNGYGMGYEDLSEKYVLIGKDKRDDNTLDEKTKNELMGRKGIGKLAALYLSNRYYLISKTKNEISAWCLDTSISKDSDIPHLDKKKISDINIESESEWNKFKTGTMIKLTDVDLSYFGDQTLAGLKARLADYYLLDSLHGEMEIAFITNRFQKCNFEKAEKSIAFKNMYAFYNISKYDYSNYLASSVFLHSNITSIANKKRKVFIIDSKRFPEVQGKKRFKLNDGSLSEEIPYILTGWIGIHSSINKEEAIINDAEYLKNKAYRPNHLRLYVRNKLAVENFLDYVKNTQAFSNYIEGEISFNILDDNRLPDIATSNRQGFTEDDERIILLIDILKPIINLLIRERVKIGQIIKEEEKEYIEKQRREEETKRKNEEEKRKKEYEARIEAEKERDLAITKKEKAEKEAEQLNEELEFTNKDLNSEKRRTKLLMNSLSINQLDVNKRLHMAKININTINSIVQKMVLKNNRGKLTVAEIWENIKRISFNAERVRANLNYGMKANFDTQEEKITEDLFSFISDYCSSVLSDDDLSIHIKKENIARMTFVPQNVAVVLENIISNSKKAHSKNIYIHMYENAFEYFVDLKDDGKDSSWRKVKNTNELFEFGKGFTSTGSGIGLYHVREIVKSMNGTTAINSNIANGFEINLRLKK